MKTVRFAALAAFSIVGSAASAAPTVLNPSFENPSTTDGYGPIASWAQVPFPSGNPGFANGYLTGTESSGVGVFDNGTTSGKAAFLQAYGPFGNDSMSLTQTVTGFDDGQTYKLTYDENARAGTSVPNLEVLVGGVSVLAIHADGPVEANGTHATAFRAKTSSEFTVTGGSALVEFRATNATAGANQDSSALIDNVSIIAVPEPATVSLLGFGGLGLLARRRRA